MEVILHRRSIAAKAAPLAAVVAVLVFLACFTVPMHTNVAEAATAVDTCTIKYEGVAGASNANPVKVQKGTTLSLKKPFKTGYSFAGWYQGKKKVTKLKVTKDVAVSAKWKAKSYKIVYKNAKGAATSPKTFKYGKAVKLKAPKKAGYTFKGWYSDKYLTKKVTKVGGKTAKNVTVYGKWVKNPVTRNQKLAVKAAKRILASFHNGDWDEDDGIPAGCSQSLLISSLREGGLSKKDAIFGADNSGANWYQEAKRYAEYCATVLEEDADPSDSGDVFTESDIRYYLKRIKFTSNQISYALKNARIDWLGQAEAFFTYYFESGEVESADEEYYLSTDDETEQYVLSITPKEYEKIISEARAVAIKKGLRNQDINVALKRYLDVDWNKSAAAYVTSSVSNYWNQYGVSPYPEGEHECNWDYADLTPQAYNRIRANGISGGFTNTQMDYGFRQFIIDWYGIY